MRKEVNSYRDRCGFVQDSGIILPYSLPVKTNILVLYIGRGEPRSHKEGGTPPSSVSSPSLDKGKLQLSEFFYHRGNLVSGLEPHLLFGRHAHDHPLRSAGEEHIAGLQR